MVISVITYLIMSSDKVKEEALKLYNQKKEEGMEFSSQCLGTINAEGVEYAVDIVHVPRAPEDDLPQNQCDDFRSGRVKHFIELDKEGNVVRIM